MTAPPALAVQNLVKRYGEVLAVDGVSFEVDRGTIVGLLGRNGAGKTTTLEACVGLVMPTSGTIRVLGLDPTRRQDRATLRRRIGVQLQTTSLPEKARPREILDLYAAYYGVPARTDALAEQVGLRDVLDHPMGGLSGGEQQRLALALALLHDPDVLFLDEPTAGMDAFGRRILWAEVERLRSSGKALVLTTHYIEEAERLADEILVIQRGRIVARDTPAALVAQYGGDASIEFVARGWQPDHGLERLGRWTHDGQRWQVRVHGEPGIALGELVARANALGVTIEELDLHRPGLEDAFLTLTGERIAEGGTEAVAA